MMQKAIGGIPQRSLLYLLTCAAGVLAFAVVGLHPLQRQLRELDRDIFEVRGRIEDQKVLYPLYEDVLNRSGTGELEGMRVRTRQPLAQKEIGSLTTVVSELARSSKLQLASLAPDAKLLASGSRLLPVHAALKGAFSNMRGFLLEVEKLPFVEHLEELQIQDSGGAKELKLKMWIAISER